jgi:hypothetical protein
VKHLDDVAMIALAALATWIVTGHAVLNRGMSVSQEEFILFFLITSGTAFIARAVGSLIWTTIKQIRNARK